MRTDSRLLFASQGGYADASGMEFWSGADPLQYWASALSARLKTLPNVYKYFGITNSRFDIASNDVGNRPQLTTDDIATINRTGGPKYSDEGSENLNGYLPDKGTRDQRRSQGLDPWTGTPVHTRNAGGPVLDAINKGKTIAQKAADVAIDLSPIGPFKGFFDFTRGKLTLTEPGVAAIIIVIGILLLAIAAYSIVVPESGRSQIANTIVKAAI